MKRIRKLTITVLPILIVVTLAVGSFFFFNGRQQLQPDNPLLYDANPSHMLLSFGGTLELSDDPNGDSGKENDNENAEEPTKSETTKRENEEPETEKPDQTIAANEPVTQPEEQVNVSQPDINNHSLDSLEVTEVDKTDEESSILPDKSDIGSEDNSEDTVNKEEEITHVSEGEIEENVPGEVQKPVEDEIDKVYFTTSIKDGETVNKSDYSFEIYHNYPELTVNSVRVYVNDTEVNQFKGNVLLSEGRNIIRVSVEYKDESGKVISVYSDYSVNAKLGRIEIITDLKNHETATNLLDFTASAKYYGETVSINVTLNSEIVEPSDGKYSVKLKNGENRIFISASSEDMTESREFIITCTALDTLDLYTDLEDKTVNSESLEFTAYILNGTSRAKLTVTLNGNPIKGTGDVFTAPLEVGTNRIRLKATDKLNGESITVDRTFTIKMVPLANEETAPYLRYINVTDGMSVKGNEFKLDLEPVDYKGNRIYSEGITVKLNGNIYKYEWQSEYTSYKLWFEGGENELEIRISDKDGRYTDYSFKVNCEVFADGAQIGTITISIDANVLGLGYIVSPTEIPIYQGENGAEAVTRFLEENGFTYDYDGTLDVGFYLSRICKSGIGIGVNIPEKLVEYINADGIEWKSQKYDDSLGEFDYTQGSGWMYSINQSFPNHGLSDAFFKDGDVVRIRFTLAYGKDINGFTAAGGQSSGEGGNYEKTW
ncbi:MAG: DUF4430 domain-containing protein [Acutalibacteraceae bacterium]